MRKFSLDYRDPTPLYAQLERAIRTAIATGRLKPGARLPTVRQMAVDLAINANTVAKVYAALERTEVLETQRGVGTFVRAGQSPVILEKNRRRELDRIVSRFLPEVSALGFTVRDLVAHLQHKLRQENNDDAVG